MMSVDIEYLTEWPPPPRPVEGTALPSPSDHDTLAGREGQSSLKRQYHSSDEDVADVKKLKSDTCALSTDHTLWPTVLLAQWWKRIKDKPSLTLPSTSTCYPRTLIHHIAQLPEGQAFLAQRISFLKAKRIELCNTSQEWIVHHNIAACYHKLGPGLEHTAPALYHANQALQVQPCRHRLGLGPGYRYLAPEPHSDGAMEFLDQPPGDEEVRWLLEQLVRQRDAEERRCGLEGELKLKGILTMPTPVEVERRCASGLSVEEFYRCYALTHTPLIITGLVDHMTTTPWTLAYMEQKLGDMVVPVKRMVEGSVEWARLESVGLCSLRHFIHSLDNGKENRYLFDWSLPIYCPELLTELSIPKYFATDFLQRTPEGSLYNDSWPSLFIAPPQVVSELHVDTFGSNFWMALFQGRKRWIFFPPEDTPLLYPVYAHSTDAIFEAQLSAPDLTLHPHLSLTRPRHCTLEPGEVLYVPAGCPHRVENLEKSLAISANFIDGSNFELAKKELSAIAYIDYRAQQLLEVLTSTECRVQSAEHGPATEETVSEITGTAHETSTEDVELCISWTDFKHQGQLTPNNE